MIIETTLSELSETIFEYGELIGFADEVEVPEDDDLLGIKMFRTTVPELGFALREGTLYTKSEDEDEDEWNPDASLVLIYNSDEMDPAEYLGWSAGDYQSIIYDFCRSKFKNYSDLDNIPCFIDTSEFFDDEEQAEKLAAECEKEYERLYK